MQRRRRRQHAEGEGRALAKMVKQDFAAPATPAGVERVFSAAGKMHGDLQKSAKDSSLDARALALRGVQHRLTGVSRLLVGW